MSVKNRSEQLTYGRFRFQPLGFTIKDLNLAPDMFGTVGPGETARISADLNGDWRDLMARSRSPIEVLAAEPILPRDATDLRADGEAPPYVPGPNRAPEASPRYIVKTRTSSNVVGMIAGVTTELTAMAWGPDFDPLTYTWSASNGTISGNGANAFWKRVVDNNRMLPGTVTVVISDGRGGKTTVNYELK